MKILQNYDSPIGEQTLIAFTGIFTAVREKHGKSDVTVRNQLEPSPEASKIGLVGQKCMKLNGTVQD